MVSMGMAAKQQIRRLHHGADRLEGGQTGQTTVQQDAAIAHL
jgi:hypothetical protein